MDHQDLLQGWIEFEPHFLSPDESKMIYSQLIRDLPWKQGEITLFGKKHLTPRLESFHALDQLSYGYSGQALKTEPMSETLLLLKSSIEQASGYEFNSVLVNFYRNGADSNGWHSDNEKELGKNPVIASLSLGAERRFDLRHNKTGETKHFQLNSGSLLIMGGEMQHYWKHQVPKSKKVNAGRINLTFRKVFP